MAPLLPTPHLLPRLLPLLLALLLPNEGALAQLTDPFDTALCQWDDFMDRANAVDGACCGDPAAGCPPGGGFPSVCSPECALTFVPFADQCRDLIGQLMPAQQPAIDTLSDRCVTGNNEDLFRMIRDLQDASCCVDTSMIVPADMAFGDVEYERDWVLVFRHDIAGGFFQDRADALSKNPDDPTASLFSRLDTLESYRNQDNQLAFKMVWPELSPVNSNTWLQESNPFADGAPPRAEGYMPIRLHFSGDYDEAEDGAGPQLFEGLLPAEGNPTLADLDAGHCWWGALGATERHACGIPGPVCNPGSDRHCDVITGACGEQEGATSCFADYSKSFNVGKVELWVAAPPPPPAFFQISYAGTQGCGGESVQAGQWCASIDPHSLGDASSDLKMHACDVADPRQGFSYDERTMLLQVQADPTMCVMFSHSDAHGACEPYTLAACDSNDESQKFVLEELSNADPAVFQWHSVAQSQEVGEVAIDLNGCSPSDGQFIWACPANGNDAKHWQMRSMHVESESDWAGGAHALFHSSDTMSHGTAEAWCVEKGGRLAVLDSAMKEGAAQEVLLDTPAWIAAYCPAENEGCGANPPGDASASWFWYDEVGRQIHSVAEGFRGWNGEAGAKAVDGKTQFCAVHVSGREGSWESEACDSDDKVALCEWPADEVPGNNGDAPTMSTMTIVQATYGGNCDGYGVQPGNENEHLQDECNGEASCSYHIDHRVIGDPAGGCPKDYRVVYDCGCGEQEAQVGGADDPNGHEASGQTITFDCSACTQIHQGPFCSVSVFQHGDHQGWEAVYTDGDYDGEAFVAGGARDNDASSLTVTGPGCVAVCYEEPDLGLSGGWEATFTEGDYMMGDFVAAGAGNDQFSSMRVFHVDDCMPPASTQWRVTISSVVGGGDQVQLTELSLLDGDQQLGVGRAAPEVSPAITNLLDIPEHEPGHLNNGDPAAIDQMNCNPLPCSYTYTFPLQHSVTAVRMAHADSPGRYPSGISVAYMGANGQWVELESMTMLDPAFQTLTDYPLTSAACSMVDAPTAAITCPASHPYSYYHSRACCSGPPAADLLSCPSGDFQWCDGTNDGSLGSSKTATCGPNAAAGNSGGGHRRAQMFGGMFGNLDADICPFDTFNERSAELNAVCCTGGDCVGNGLPPTCSFDCAVVYNSIYDDCYTLLSTMVGPDLLPTYDNFADQCFNFDARSIIYAAGSADCSLRGTVIDEEGWILLVRQDASDANGGFFSNAEDVLSHNAELEPEAARSAHLYSNLDQIENYRGLDGSFTLKLQWPDLSPIDHNIWKQSNLPQSEAARDYVPIEMQFASSSTNIALAPSDSVGSTLMDSDEGSCWYGAIGTYAQYGCGITGPVCSKDDPLCVAVTGHCGTGEQDANGACGWISDSRYFTVPTAELYVRAPAACIGNRMCTQPAPFLCSEEFALVSHVVVIDDTTVDWSSGAAEGAALPEDDDPNTAKFSDAQINTWLQTYGHENVVFKVVIDGSEESARYYKFDSPRQEYSSGLINYNHVCASMHETEGFVCGPQSIWDSNQSWRGLASVMNRGLRQADDPCPSGEGGDGFHGIANSQNRVYDRCGGLQGVRSGTIDTYMKIREE
jgi:hypothetical protein